MGMDPMIEQALRVLGWKKETLTIDVEVMDEGVLKATVNDHRPVMLSSMNGDSLTIGEAIELKTHTKLMLTAPSGWVAPYTDGMYDLVAPRGSVSVSGTPDPYAFMSRDQAVRQLKWERRRADRLRAKVKRLKRQRDKARRRAR